MQDIIKSILSELQKYRIQLSYLSIFPFVAQFKIYDLRLNKQVGYIAWNLLKGITLEIEATIEKSLFLIKFDGKEWKVEFKGDEL